MLPLIIDPEKLTVIVMGDGPATVRRLEMLETAGVKYDHIKTLNDLEKKHGQQTEPFSGEALGSLHEQQASAGASKIVFISDFDAPTSARLYREAKAANCLVNVEDKKNYCDFHVPATVRRGDLLLTISTGAASPRLARRLRMMLETLFPPQWSDWLETIRQKRDQWKAEGASFAELAEKTDTLLDEKGWLQKDCACVQASTKNRNILGQQAEPFSGEALGSSRRSADRSGSN